MPDCLPHTNSTVWQYYLVYTTCATVFFELQMETLSSWKKRSFFLFFHTVKGSLFSNVFIFKPILRSLLRSSKPVKSCFSRLCTLRTAGNEKTFPFPKHSNHLFCLLRSSKPDICYLVRLYWMIIAWKKTFPQTFKFVVQSQVNIVSRDFAHKNR